MLANTAANEEVQNENQNATDDKDGDNDNNDVAFMTAQVSVVQSREIRATSLPIPVAETVSSPKMEASSQKSQGSPGVSAFSTLTLFINNTKSCIPM